MSVKKVLLINPAFAFEPKNWMGFVFPFGLGYVAACLQRDGHNVDVWDISAEEISYSEVEKRLPSVLAKGYDHIGITGIVNQYLYIRRLADDLKKLCDSVITCGGPLASYSHSILLKETRVDICVLGNGEFTYSKLVGGKPVSELDGVAYRDGGEIRVTADAGPPKDLDALPRPAYELFDMDHYISHTRLMSMSHPWYRGRRVAAMITARGCPYNCTFCSKSTRNLSLRSIDCIMDELRFLVDSYGISALLFEDELLVISKERTLELCKRIKPLNLVWCAQARVNLVDREMIRAMKDAGCVGIGYGIESGSQMILDKMKKRITVQQIKDALTISKEEGLPVKVQLIFGYPGETRETVDETLNLFRELRYPARKMNIITPLPGCALYDEAKEDGFIGDGQNNVISEVKFLEYLSLNGGMCQRHFFYNRTAFTDEEFPREFDRTQALFLLNFTRAMFLHPLDLLRYWSVYKFYLREWINYYKGDFRNRKFLKNSKMLLDGIKQRVSDKAEQEGE